MINVVIIIIGLRLFVSSGLHESLNDLFFCIFLSLYGSRRSSGFHFAMQSDD